MVRGRMPSHLMEYTSKNYTKAEIAERAAEEVIMSGENIQPSDFLPKKLHKKFEWFVEEFEQYGIIANVDSDALSRYIMADYQYWETTKILNKMKPDETGYSRLSTVQNRYFSQSQGLAKELGLTMVSRSKLRREDEKEVDKELSKEEQLFGGALGG